MPRRRKAPQKPKRHELPSWLGPKRLMLAGAVFMASIPALTLTTVWLYDQGRHHSLYALCDELPVAREFVPLRREVFMHGCYTQSVCPDDLYTVSQMLARYEIKTTKHCLRSRVQRPDRAITGWVNSLSAPERPPRVPQYDIEYEINMAEAYAPE